MFDDDDLAGASLRPRGDPPDQAAASGSDRPEDECRRVFANIYPARARSERAVRDALRRLKQCRAEGKISPDLYETMRVALRRTRDDAPWSDTDAAPAER